MAEIKIKRSNVPGKAPAVGDLVLGELAINTYDGKLFLKRNDGTETIVEIGGGGGSSGSGVTVGTTPPESPQDSALWWDSSSGTLKIYYNDGSSSQWVDTNSSEKSAAVTAEAATSVYSNQYVVSGTTTDNTETEIFIDGVLNQRMPVALDTVCAYTVDIVAKRTDVPGDVAMFTIKSLARNDSGTVSDVGNIYEVVVARTDINLNVDIRANDTANAFGIYVTGVNSKTFSWRAVVSTVEV